MDKLTAIKVFLSVAETGSFTAAADRLDMSKPMITRHIALMEEWLNARLFQRTTRQVRLTDAGEQALVFCQKMLALSGEMEQELAAQQGDLRGNIRLSSSGSFGAVHLTQAVNVFLREHPNLSIHLELSDKLLDLVAERIDLAVRITNHPDPNLVARKLAPCRSLIVATPEYLARFGTPKHPEDLRHHRYLTHANINRKEWYFYQENQELVLELTSQLTTNETTVLLNSVLSHSGVAMLPKYLLEDYLQNGQLQAVLTDWQLPEFTIYLLYPSRHKLPLAVRALVDFLAGYFADRDW
ncbi:MAG: LysR family transcriptional regulator [Neisseria sp.]|uniref:LysR family transcriptional regulator n=1 Tax=Neisseria sp. TaxID=192066 RepID=UPI0026DD6BEC|nr:LysR family transcriptional regulator [Neisseria sp.]MDO4248255.1 LysR family transcriptional regulator [Neisseria sp.]